MDVTRIRNLCFGVTTMCLSLAMPASRATAQATSADSAGIRQAAMDYIEGWYSGDAERMARALHPELAKRIVRTDPKSGRSNLGQMSAMTLLNGTRMGGGKHAPAAQQRKECLFLDSFQG